VPAGRPLARRRGTVSRGRVVVTGAAGFIGRHACRRLAESGWEVVGLDLHRPEPDADVGDPQVTVGDFRDEALVAGLLRGADAILHLASAHLQVRLPEREYWSVNADSLPRLVEQAREAGVRRLVHVSSVGVHGDLARVPAGEDEPCRPKSAYGASKLKGEELVREAAQRCGLPVVVLRPAWVYGPGCPRTEKLYRALRRRRMPVIGRADNRRHPLFVDELLGACRLALLREEAVGQILLLAGPEIVTSRELIETACEALDVPRPWLHLPRAAGLALALACEAGFGALGREPPFSRRSLEFFATDNGFDVGRARRVLGFEPRVTLREGLARTRPWLERRFGSPVAGRPARA
jgi:nucleoside-diphosphate-sugar epimerase